MTKRQNPENYYLTVGINRTHHKYMASNKYYPEDVLVEKIQSGEYGWLEYVNHHSAEWQEEYESYCLNNGLCICEESAEQFVHHKDEELEKAIENGEA